MSVSAATLTQETLSLEGDNPCQFVVLFEDALTHDLAMEVCGGLVARFETELAFAFSFWKLRDLSDPVSAQWAAEAMARADVILFSLSGRELAPETSRWLDMCAQARTKLEGALALIVAEPMRSDLTIGALVSQVQFAALRLRMDFLPLLPPPPEENSEASAAPWPAGLTEFREETGGDHWGLNE